MADEKKYSFFAHRECEFYPCHEGADADDFSCLFCFCPLFALGDGCGGDVKYTGSGLKDCSGCLYPHRRENYDEIMDKCARLMEMTRRKSEG